jgi:hypothetical protein
VGLKEEICGCLDGKNDHSFKWKIKKGNSGVKSGLAVTIKWDLSIEVGCATRDILIIYFVAGLL